MFDIPDVEKILEERIALELLKNAKPERDAKADRIIDGTYGMVKVAGQSYYTSELLFNVDPVAYRELGANVEDAGSRKSEENED